MQWCVHFQCTKHYETQTSMYLGNSMSTMNHKQEFKAKIGLKITLRSSMSTLLLLLAFLVHLPD